MTRGQFNRKNERRATLIHEKLLNGLSPAERAELEQLQQECMAYLKLTHPLPAIPTELRDLLSDR